MLLQKFVVFIFCNCKDNTIKCLKTASWLAKQKRLIYKNILSVRRRRLG